MMLTTPQPGFRNQRDLTPVISGTTASEVFVPGGIFPEGHNWTYPLEAKTVLWP